MIDLGPINGSAIRILPTFATDVNVIRRLRNKIQILPAIATDVDEICVMETLYKIRCVISLFLTKLTQSYAAKKTIH